MNKVFKKIWNKHRGCFVAVSEAMTSASQRAGKASVIIGALAASSLLTAQELTVTEGDVSYDSLNGYTALNFIQEVKNVTIGEIYSPEAFLEVNSLKKYPDVSSNLEIASAPNFTVLGNSIIKSAFVSGNDVAFNGDVTVIGTIDNSVVNADIENPSIEVDYQTLFESLLKSGGIFHASTINNDGVKIKGNLTASFVRVSGGLTDDANPDFYSKLTVDGNVTADNILIDSPLKYDDQCDLMTVKGIVTVSNNLRNNGYLDVQKLIVAGKLLNGTGTYVGGTEDVKTGAVIGELDASYIENGSVLTVGKLLRTDNVELVQTFGTTVVEDNWFENSVITLKGGELDASNFGTEQSLGAGNRYIVSGGTLKTEDFSGSSSIELSDAGELQSSIDGVFQDYDPTPAELHVVGLNAAADSEARSVLTEIFKKYLPGSVSDQFAETVTLSGGKVIITGVNITQTQADDLVSAFKSKIFSPFS